MSIFYIIYDINKTSRSNSKASNLDYRATHYAAVYLRHFRGCPIIF
jgi:hypothetical protein